MKKRSSRRRWKARIRQGKWVPWMAVVEHGLSHWTGWEHDGLGDMARIPLMRIHQHTVRYDQSFLLSREDLGERRWAPIT